MQNYNNLDTHTHTQTDRLFQTHLLFSGVGLSVFGNQLN